MKIIEKNIADISAYENNPRRNENGVEKVAASISEFGFKVPIIIDKNNVIVCGHTRVKAARKLKIKTIPCVIADDLTDEQIKGFRIADNKTAEFSDWDFKLLDDELSKIIDIDMSEFGFFDESINDDELEDLIESEVEQRNKEVHKVEVICNSEEETKIVEKLLTDNGYIAKVTNK